MLKNSQPMKKSANGIQREIKVKRQKLSTVKKTSNTLGQLSKMKALNRRFFQGLHKPLKFLQS